MASQCKPCQMSFATDSQAISHLNEFHRSKPCLICGRPAAKLDFCDPCSAAHKLAIESWRRLDLQIKALQGEKLKIEKDLFRPIHAPLLQICSHGKKLSEDCTVCEHIHKIMQERRKEEIRYHENLAREERLSQKPKPLTRMQRAKFIRL